MVTGDSQEEVMIFRYTHCIIIYIYHHNHHHHHLDNVSGGEQGDPLGDQVGKVDEGGAGGRRAREQEQLWSVVLHMFAHPEEQREF